MLLKHAFTLAAALLASSTSSAIALLDSTYGLDALTLDDYYNTFSPRPFTAKAYTTGSTAGQIALRQKQWSETALALHYIGGVWQLTPARLHFQYYPAADDQPEGARLTSTVKGAVWHIANSRLAAGPVPGAVSFKRGEDDGPITCSTEYDGAAGMLYRQGTRSLICKKIPWRSEKLAWGYWLTISQAGVSKTIHGNVGINVLWMGDLDRDGYPDMIARDTGDGSCMRLFLSTAAGATGQFVPAAQLCNHF